EVDGRDLRQCRIDTPRCFHAPFDLFDDFRWDIQQTAPLPSLYGQVHVRPVQLAFGTAAAGLAAPTHLALKSSSHRRLDIWKLAGQPCPACSKLANAEFL